MEKVVRGAEWQKMVAGEPYDAGDPELKAARERCRRLYHTFNTSWQERPGVVVKKNWPRSYALTRTIVRIHSVSDHHCRSAV